MGAIGAVTTGGAGCSGAGATGAGATGAITGGAATTATGGGGVLRKAYQDATATTATAAAMPPHINGPAERAPMAPDGGTDCALIPRVGSRSRWASALRRASRM